MWHNDLRVLGLDDSDLIKYDKIFRHYPIQNATFTSHFELIIMSVYPIKSF